MTALILLTLFQAPPAQDKPIEERIAAFLKGDADARAELLRLGAYAIRPLQAARDKAPEKVDALVFELKRGAAHPKNSAFAETLTGKGVLTVKDQELKAIVPTLTSQGLLIFLDQFEPADVKSSRVTFEKLTKSREILDQICRQTGLDYGFFHNHVVLARPDRLWPAGPPTKPPPLKGDDLAKAKALVEKLGDDSIEVRESATKDLLAFGPPVVALLETNLKRKEGELASRCAALIDKLTPRGRSAFGPPGVERQKRSDAEEKALAHLKKMKVSLAFEKSPIEDVAGYIGAFAGLPLEIQGDAGKASVTIQAKDLLLIDFLCLITQSRDLDFMLQDERILIDSREGIEKRASGGK